MKDKEYVFSDTEIKKLKVRVTPAGSKTFYLFWKKNGKLNKYRIGLFGDGCSVIAPKFTTTVDFQRFAHLEKAETDP